MKPSVVLLAALAASRCGGQEARAPEPMTQTALLTIVASPVAGTTATAVRDITCPVRLQIERPDGHTVRGTFERSTCTALLNPKGELLPGAYELITTVRRLGRQTLFLSNNPTRDPKMVVSGAMSVSSRPSPISIPSPFTVLY